MNVRDATNQVDVRGILVIGHRNPDTDCTVAAITYAALKQSQAAGDGRYIPAVLGPLNAETRAVLERFGAATPIEIADVLPRVQDIMTPDPRTVTEDATLYAVADLMHDRQISTVPVVAAENRLRGVVTVDDIAERYLEELQLRGLHDIPTAAGAIAALLVGQIVAGDAGAALQGDVKVGAMQAETTQGEIARGDIVILGDRELVQQAALRAGAACLIVVGGAGVSEEIRALARAHGATIITSPYDTYATARLVNMAVPTARIMQTDVPTVTPDALIGEARRMLIEMSGRSLVVVDDDDRVVGVASRTDFLRRERRRVVLVDHSQRAQSVEGLETAEIVEVIDHHNIGDVSTGAPIFFLAEPVGATATLITEMYLDPGRWYHLPHPERVFLDEKTAGLLLSAIVSDTLLLRSPTTTPRDLAALTALADRTGIDVEAWAKEMFAARSDISERSAAQLVRNDYKPYTFGGKAVGVAQVDVMSLDGVRGRYDELREELAAEKQRQGLDVALLMMTDIFGEATDLLFDPESRPIVERAFGVRAEGGYAHLPGVVSRKKQLIPPLSAAL